MPADLQTLTSAIQLLFLAYVVSLARGLASRTTLILAAKLLFFAEVLAEGHVAALSRVPRIYGPNRGQTLRKVVVDSFVLIVNLYYIHLFLEQLLQEPSALEDSDVKDKINAATAFSYPLTAAMWIVEIIAVFFFWLLFSLPWTRLADVEGLYLRFDELSALTDVVFYQLLAMNACISLRGILVAVLPSTDIPEGTMDESDILAHLDWLLGQQLNLGWALYAFLLLELAFEMADEAWADERPNFAE